MVSSSSAALATSHVRLAKCTTRRTGSLIFPAAKAHANGDLRHSKPTHISSYNRQVGRRCKRIVCAHTRRNSGIPPQALSNDESDLQSSEVGGQSYEFSEEEDKVFYGLRQVLRKVSLLNLFLGSCNLSYALIVVCNELPQQKISTETQDLLNLGHMLNSFTTPLATMYASYLLYTAAEAFNNVVQTEGEDIKHMLEGLSNLDKVFKRQAPSILIASGVALLSLASCVVHYSGGGELALDPEIAKTAAKAVADKLLLDSEELVMELSFISAAI